MDIKAKVMTGLFIVSYEIGGNIPGAPLFNVIFSVFTPGEAVHGIGHITQTTHPPLDIATKLTGQYTYMCVMPESCHILVTATGYPIIKWPQGGGPGPVILPNVELHMVLSEDWKSGTANYKYQDSNGNWNEISNAQVKIVSANTLA